MDDGLAVSPHGKRRRLGDENTPPANPAGGRLRYACVHCGRDLDGLSRADRIRHIGRCDQADHAGEAGASGAPGSRGCAVVTPGAPNGITPQSNAHSVLMDAARARASAAAAASAAVADAPDDAFQRLMAGKAAAPSTSAAAPAADQAVSRGGGRAGGRGGGRFGFRGAAGRRLAPYKTIEGTPYVVDGFTAEARADRVYFLTHFHSDHYMGIDKRWSRPIYATHITAALARRSLGVSAELLRILPMNERVRVSAPSGGAGATVMAIDANHCPGAAMLLFEIDDGRAVLHVGDFRYVARHTRPDIPVAARCLSLPSRPPPTRDTSPHVSQPSMSRHVSLAPLIGRLDLLYLDTTYAQPKHVFPTQQAAAAISPSGGSESG